MCLLPFSKYLCSQIVIEYVWNADQPRTTGVANSCIPAYEHIGRSSSIQVQMPCNAALPQFAKQLSLKYRDNSKFLVQPPAAHQRQPMLHMREARVVLNTSLHSGITVASRCVCFGTADTMTQICKKLKETCVTKGHCKPHHIDFKLSFSR